MALYNEDNSIFDPMQLPPAYKLNDDREMLIDNLLMECGEFEFIYSEPQFAKFAIMQWSKKNLGVWRELQKTMEYEYNPIHNYDREETETISGSNDTSRTIGNNGSRERNIIRDLNETIEIDNDTNVAGRNTDTGTAANVVTTDSESSQEMDSTTLNSVFGFNESTAADRNKSVVNSTTETTGLITADTQDEHSNVLTISTDTTETGTSTKENDELEKETETTKNDIDEIIENDTDSTRTMSARGNIGVTSTQQMISEQRELVLFNLTDVIIESFKMRFCLMVY